MSNFQGVTKRVIRYIVTSLHRIDRSMVQRFNGLTWRSHSSFSYRAFTLIELVVVLGLIIVLTGLVLSTAGYARKKGARARAETEIAAISAACENYKADNGVYPRDTTTNTTDTLAALTASPTPDPRPTSYDATNPRYSAASFYLYTQLSGDTAGNRSPTGKSYMTFRPNMLLPPGGNGTVTAIADPFGNSYGYSTAQQLDPTKGFNPTFDLWSTAGTSSAVDAAYEQAWIKNW
jgi:type II secretory pathway pseudopilin PulG